MVRKSAFVFALLSAACLSLYSVLNGAIVNNVGPYTSGAVRYAFQGFKASPALFRNLKWTRMSCTDWLYIMISGVCFAMVTILALEALKYIPPLDGTAIFNCQTIIVIIIAYFWLKERIGLYDVCLILPIICGVFIICQPQFIFGSEITYFGTDRNIGYLLAVLVAFTVAIGNCIVRKLSEFDSYVVSSLQSTAAVLTILIVGSMKMNPPKFHYEWAYLFIGSICGALGRIFATIAYSLVNAAYVSAVATSETVITSMLQIAIMGIIPNYLTIIGSVMVVTCVILMSLKVTVLNCFRKYIDCARFTFGEKNEKAIKGHVSEYGSV
ncbi:Uncharacterised protein g9536 [Pycnogonum litorale]